MHAVEVALRSAPGLRDELDEAERTRLDPIGPALEVEPPGVEGPGIDPARPRPGDAVDAVPGGFLKEMPRLRLVRDLATRHDAILR